MTAKLLLLIPNNSVKVSGGDAPNGSIGRQFVRVGGTARTLCELNDPANQLISMPILVREPDRFPDNLFECADSLTKGNAWWVFHTIARREKELVRRLRAAQITCYCPQIIQRHRSPAGRVRTSFVPSFGGYVFACGDEHDRHMALASNCVSRCLTMADGEELYRDLSQVWRLIARKAPLTPEERLEPGQRVTVRAGPLAGFHGTVVQRRGGHRLIAAVNFLQRGMSALLEDTDVAAS